MATALLDPNLHTAPAGPSREEARPPSGRSGRVAAIDIARGVALLGMFTVHVPYLAERPNGTWDWILTAPQGRASVLFFMLSGVALSLIARKGSRSAEPSVLVARGAVLLLFGLVMAGFWAGSSILVQYGLVFLVAPWLLRRSTRALLAIVAGALLLGPVAVALLDINAPSLVSQQSGAVTAYFGHVLTSALFSTHALVVWLGFFAIGLLLGRTDLTSRRTAAWTFGAGVALTAAATVGILSTDHLVDDGSFFGSTVVDATAPDATGAVGGKGPTTDAEAAAAASKIPVPADEPIIPQSGYFVFNDEPVPFDWKNPVWTNLLSGEPHSNTTPWALQSAGIALAVIGLLALLPGVATRLLSPLAALGSISLTAYVFHPFLVQDVWTWTDPISSSFTWEMLRLAISMALLVTLGWVVKRRWKQGPLEWALHRLGMSTRIGPTVLA